MPTKKDKPPTIWEADPTFWDNRRFVAWQLLRRNSAYQAKVAHFFSQSPFMASIAASFPPLSSDETFKQWGERYEEVRLSTPPPGTDQGFLAQEQWRAHLKSVSPLPGDDPYFGHIWKSPIPYEAVFPESKKARRRVKRPREKNQVVMVFHLDSNEVEVIPYGKEIHSLNDPQHRGSMWKDFDKQFFFLDPEIDFPPPTLLSRITQEPPSEKNKRAYEAYLYDKLFEPFASGQGRPRNIKEALEVWDMSTKQNIKDSDIARHLFGLEYTHPDKPKALQRVHDLKVRADKAIRSIYK